MTRIALFSDVHGVAEALAAVREAVRSAAPDVVAIAGDLAMNGADPAATIDGVRELEAAGALVVQGNTDIAVADFDYGAAFPWFGDGVPESMKAAAAWAHEAIGPERVDWLRRLPAERRVRADDDTMLLVTHASPGSQTAGFDQGLDESVFLERLGRTDARVICCGHTHVPEVRDFGWKVVVNSGSAGYVFDGEATASWALIDVVDGHVTAEVKRVEFDAIVAADAVAARGLPGDVYRAATIRTGKLVR
jgi:predicted phosphodiesterase